MRRTSSGPAPSSSLLRLRGLAGDAQAVLAVSSIMDSEMCWSVNSAAKHVKVGAPFASGAAAGASLPPFCCGCGCCSEVRSIGGAISLRFSAFQSMPSKKACCFSADTPPESAQSTVRQGGPVSRQQGAAYLR